MFKYMLIGMTITFIIAIAIIFPCVGLLPNYSEGQRSGTVFKVSNKGIFFKSHEGSMNIGGVSTDANGNTFPSTFHFSITNNDIATQIAEAAKNGKRVTLTYNQYFIKPIKIDTPYVVTKVEYLNN